MNFRNFAKTAVQNGGMCYNEREYRRKSTPESCIEIQFKGVKSMIKVGFIDYYLDEWHANNYVHMLRDYSNGEVEAVYAWAEIDSPEDGLTTDAWCEKYGLTRMMTQEELIEKSDVLLVLAPRDPKKHEELANLALRSGKRCYVDKTFAPDHFAAKRMLDLAEQSGTPCWSSSALRFAEEYQAADKTNIKGVNTWGPNGFEDYAIHQLEPILIHMVHTKFHTWKTLFPYKRSLRPIEPSSFTLLGWFRLSPIDQYSSLLPPVGVWTVSQFQCGGPSSQNPYPS